jgi:hypothetical protein
MAFWLLAPRTAVAETTPIDDAARAKARALAYAGVEAYAVGEYAVASEKLEESYSLLSVPSLGLWSARSLVKLGKLVEAEARYRAVSALRVAPSDPRVQQSAQLDAARELQDLLPKIPSLELELSGTTAADVDVELDGVRLSRIDLGQIRWVNPGRHNVVGTRGAEKSEVVLNMREGAHEQVLLRFSPAPPTTEPTARVTVPSPAPVVPGTRGTLRTVGWIALTAAGASLTTGVAAYLVGNSIYTDFRRRSSCANGECSQTEVDAYNTWRTVHLAGLISGGLLGAAGVSILMTVPSDTVHTGLHGNIRVSLAPSSIAVEGTF